MKNVTASLMILVFIAINNAWSVTVADGWVIRQITTSGMIPAWGAGLAISGDKIVWLECINQGPLQVMYTDGSVVRQLSNAGNACEKPTISGSNVAWLESMDTQDRIMLWDGVTLRQISSGLNHCGHPQVSGFFVIWEEYIAGKWQLMFWDGTSARQISNSTSNLDSPQISGCNVIWLEDTYKVMLWNGSSAVQISGGTNSCDSPVISGSNAIWSEYVGATGVYNIMYWNGSANLQIGTVDEVDFREPLISGTNVVWPQGNRIMFWNGSTTQHIYEGTGIDSDNLRLQGTRVVWFDSIASDFIKIMQWDGSATKMLRFAANKLCSNLSISDSNVVWIERSTGFLFYPESIVFSDVDGTIELLNTSFSNFSSSNSSIVFTMYDEDMNCNVYLVMPGESIPPTEPLTGDINKDNRVNLGDLSILASQWLLCTAAECP